MLVIKHFSPYILGGFIFLGLGFSVFVPILMWPIIVLLSVGLIFNVWLLSDKKISSEFFNSLIAPFLLLWSIFLFNLFLESNIVKIIFSLIAGFLIFIYLEQLFYYRYLPKRYQANALENLSFYFVIFSLFLFSSSLFGFYIFLHAPKVLLLLVIILFTLVSNYQLFWALKVNFWESWPYNTVLTLALFEFFYVLMLLPTSFAVNGAMMAILYYLTLGILRYHFMDRLDRKIIKRYLIIGSLMFIFVAVSARWT